MRGEKEDKGVASLRKGDLAVLGGKKKEQEGGNERKRGGTIT